MKSLTESILVESNIDPSRVEWGTTKKREPLVLFFIYQNMILNNRPNDFLFSCLH